MSLILSGTDGLSDIDGTAATPAIRGTDANTGIFFPAADTIAFSEGGAECARFDSSGNFGIGVTPSQKLDVAGNAKLSNTTGNKRLFLGQDTPSANDSGSIEFNASSTQKNWAIRTNWNVAGALEFNQSSASGGTSYTTPSMLIDSSGNVGIGTTSPSQKLEVAGNIFINTSGNPNMTVKTSGAGNNPSYRLQADTTYWDIGASFSDATDPLTFGYGGAERMRLDSSGNLLVGTTSGLGTERLSVLRTVDSADYVAVFKTTAATAANNYGTQTVLNADPNDATRTFLSCIGGAATTRAQIRSNGGLANFSANNVNLSDERTKTDIVNAGNYLAKICAIPVRTFKYKDQTDSLLNLGVIAQEVEAIAPELVDTTGFGETPDDGIPLKAIYQTDLQYALMKCIQEQQALITALTARITALEAK